MQRRIRLPMETIAREYREGMSIPKLRAKYEVGYGTMRDRLIEAGVKLRNPGTVSLATANLPTPRVLAKRYAHINEPEPKRIRHLAVEYGVSTFTIRRRLIAAGVLT